MSEQTIKMIIILMQVVFLLGETAGLTLVIAGLAIALVPIVRRRG